MCKLNIRTLMVDAIFKLRQLFCCILFGEEGETMMAMLWTQQILLGRRTYAQVPRLLKEQVRELLIDSGYEELVVE